MSKFIQPRRELEARSKTMKTKITEDELKNLSEITGSAEYGILILLKGYVDGVEKTLLCIDISDTDTHLIYPKAVLIDLEKEEVLGPDKEPLNK